jgi:uncharacterized membrane protein YdbT with pleckstrin-like domain
MSYVDSNLLPEEQVVYREKLHWIIYVPGVIIFALIIVASVLIGEWIQSAAPKIVLFAIIIGIPFLIAPWIRSASTEFAVTNKRVIIKTGWISRKTLEMNLGKIENIGVEQGIFGRIFCYGTIIVIGTGGTREPFQKIADPLGFRKAVQAQSS